MAIDESIIDPAGGDLRPKPSCALLGTGKDLSGDFAVDIVGVLHGVEFEIGAFVFASVASTSRHWRGWTEEAAEELYIDTWDEVQSTRNQRASINTVCQEVIEKVKQKTGKSWASRRGIRPRPFETDARRAVE